MSKILHTSGRTIVCAYTGYLAPGQSCELDADSDYVLVRDGIRWAFCSADHRDNFKTPEALR